MFVTLCGNIDGILFQIHVYIYNCTGVFLWVYRKSPCQSVHISRKRNFSLKRWIETNEIPHL